MGLSQFIQCWHTSKAWETHLRLNKSSMYTNLVVYLPKHSAFYCLGVVVNSINDVNSYVSVNQEINTHPNTLSYSAKICGESLRARKCDKLFSKVLNITLCDIYRLKWEKWVFTAMINDKSFKLMLNI